jgi:hypothetical protein
MKWIAPRSEIQGLRRNTGASEGVGRGKESLSALPKRRAGARLRSGPGLTLRSFTILVYGYTIQKNTAELVV